MGSRDEGRETQTPIIFIRKFLNGKRQFLKVATSLVKLAFFSKGKDRLRNISFRLFHETQFNAYFITYNWIS